MKLLPAGFCHFLAALRREKHEFDKGGEWVRSTVECLPDRANLIVGQNAITCEVTRPCPGHAHDDGRPKLAIPGSVPVTEFPDDGQYVISHDFTAIVGNMVEEADDVPAGQLMDRSI